MKTMMGFPYAKTPRLNIATVGPTRWTCCDIQRLKAVGGFGSGRWEDLFGFQGFIKGFLLITGQRKPP